MTEANYGRRRVEDYEPTAKVTIPVEPYTTKEYVIGWIIIITVSILVAGAFLALTADAFDVIDLIPGLSEGVDEADL